MVLALLTFTHLLQSCAPNIGPRTMTAIVHVESGGNRLAVRDNATQSCILSENNGRSQCRLAKVFIGETSQS